MTLQQEQKEREELAVNAALEWIDDLPKRFEMVILEGVKRHDLNCVTKQEAKEAYEHIAEILDDLFHRDRVVKQNVFLDNRVVEI